MRSQEGTPPFPAPLPGCSSHHSAEGRAALLCDILHGSPWASVDTHLSAEPHFCSVALRCSPTPPPMAWKVPGQATQFSANVSWACLWQKRTSNCRASPVRLGQPPITGSVLWPETFQSRPVWSSSQQARQGLCHSPRLPGVPSLSGDWVDFV